MNKDAILADLDNLDYEGKHYKRKEVVKAKAKKRSILAERVSRNSIYKALIFFDKMYEPMNQVKHREFRTQFIEKIEIYEED